MAVTEEKVSLNVFLDEHCIETYIGDGVAVVTHIVYEWQSALRLPEQKKGCAIWHKRVYLRVRL